MGRRGSGDRDSLLDKSKLHASAVVITEQNMSTRTAKVLEIMKAQLEEKETVTFNELTAGASKRTAAACFLEILQLKTWDLIDVAQPQPFQDITIGSTDYLWKYGGGGGNSGASSNRNSTGSYSSRMSYNTAYTGISGATGTGLRHQQQAVAVQ